MSHTHGEYSNIEDLGRGALSLASGEAVPWGLIAIMSIRILIADDHEIIRQGLRLLFSNTPDFELVGEAENGREALERCSELQPDVCVMDIGMPVMDGFEAARLLRENQPDVRVIALSMHNDKAFVAGMIAAGAAGYVLKEAAFDQLQEAVRTVCNGDGYWPPQVE